MKTLIQKILILTIILLTLNTFVSAGETIPFSYNILPDDDSGSIIDCNKEKLTFELWENENKIFVNGNEIYVDNNYFEISITDLFGKQDFIITNDKNEEVILTYYISDENGFVKNYKSKEFKNYDVYVSTIDDIKIIYTEKDKNSIQKVINCLENMPSKTKTNLTEIKMLPNDSRDNVAGVTNYDKITLYGLYKYDKKTIENIIYHEVAHTWAYELIKEKVIDFSYTNYKRNVEKDNNFVSNYSKKAIKNSNDYSEDFAESISFFLIDNEDFCKKYPSRAEFIISILN